MKRIKAGEYNPLESSMNSVRTEDTNPVEKNRNSLGATSDEGVITSEEDRLGKRVSPEKGRDHSDNSNSTQDSEIIGSGFGSIDWSAFNVNFHSTVANIDDPKYKDTLSLHKDKMIDLRAYMIPRPHSVFENDTIQKCLDIFRLMNLRALPVVNEDDGSLVGIITRQDLFAFMSV